LVSLQTISFQPQDVTGQIVYRMSFDNVANNLSTSVSLDGGNSFQSFTAAPLANSGFSFQLQHNVASTSLVVPCGDGVLDAGEQCDPGPDVAGDCCTAGCEFVSGGTICRAAAAECDAAETCTGTATDCPADAVAPVGSACTDDGNACSDDRCDGSSPVCQHSPITGCETVSQVGGSGATVTTDTEIDGATGTDRVETSVTTPNPGVVSIVERQVSNYPPSGFTFFGQAVSIAAPAATAAQPLVIVFELDASLIPVGQNPAAIAIFRNGLAVPACTGGPGVAGPDPCLSGRAIQGDLDVRLTVFTSSASEWNFGVACHTARKSLLAIRDDSSDDGKDKLLWRWLRGQAVSQPALADPVNSAHYTLRLYVGTAATLLSEVQVPPHLTKWSAISDTGYKYLDPGGAADGIQRIVLKGSAEDTAKALLKGKGFGLPDPALGSLPLPLRAQLVNSDTSACFEASYDSDDVLKNESHQFKAKAQ
jgi:hypothetical protein